MWKTVGGRSGGVLASGLGLAFALALALTSPAHADQDVSLCLRVTNTSTGVVQQNCIPVSAAFPLPVATLAYPTGPNGAATPVTAAATGTTAATTATLPAVAGKTTYICGWRADASATAATVVVLTVTGGISGTLTYAENVGAVATAAAVNSQIYSPCVPASAVNTAIAVNGGAAGTGGSSSVSAWGFQL